MAEVEADSTGTVDTDSDAGFDLGADLDVPANGQEAPETTSTSSDEGTTDFNPSTVDFGTADPESLPPEYQKAQEWAKGRERDLQGDYTRKTQELAEMRRNLEHLQGQAAQQQNTQATPAQQAADPLEDLRRRLGEDAGAVDVVSDIIKAVSGSQHEATKSELQQLREAVSVMAQSHVQSQSQGLNTQVVEAREAYGTELDSYAPQIKALISVENPATRSAYTVKEAFELASGKAAAKSQELAATERQVRSDASSRTALQGVVGADNADDGELTPAQLAAGLQKLGFE
jgi:hypothetical protein